MPLQSDKLRLLRRIPQIRFDEESPGYSRDQVNRVLANLAPMADEIERLQARLTEAEGRAESAEARLVEARGPSALADSPDVAVAVQPDFDETLRNTLVSAQRQADLTVREATTEAERLRTEAEFQSNAMLADARDQSAEMTTEAVRYRERLMAEAAEERARRLDEAREEAQALVDEVNKELAEAHESERTRLLDQIVQLEEKHGLLEEDVSRFESYLTDRRLEVRTSIEKITGVLDDPALLREDAIIESADVEALDRDAYSEIGVSVVALDELSMKADIAAESVESPGEIVAVEDFDQLTADGVESPPMPPAGGSEQPSVVDLTDSGAGSETKPVADSGQKILDGSGFNPPGGDESQLPESGLLTDQSTVVVADHDGQASPERVEGGGFTPSVLADEPTVDAKSAEREPGPPPAANNDSYLDELRRVTDEEADADDAIADFLQEKPERGGGGWFGRRR